MRLPVSANARTKECADVPAFSVYVKTASATVEFEQRPAASSAATASETSCALLSFLGVPKYEAEQKYSHDHDSGVLAQLQHSYDDMSANTYSHFSRRCTPCASFIRQFVG
mmetsp:Transcript_47156/g.78071  ORF Transcript_47156/g.78071 Transcript_47156/m.78071 type:complete len:111 (+) Transcript_47156:412-744(+)